jgi:hypothetical protein
MTWTCSCSSPQAADLRGVNSGLPGRGSAAGQEGGGLEARVMAHLGVWSGLLVLDNAKTPWEAELAGGDVGFEELLGRLAALPEMALAGRHF